MKILTQIEAQLLNSKFFFTGEPCGNGHISKRYASCGNCFECVQVRYNAKREELKVKARAYHARDPAMHNERLRRWLEKNIEYRRRYLTEWKMKHATNEV